MMLRVAGGATSSVASAMTAMTAPVTHMVSSNGYYGYQQVNHTASTSALDHLAASNTTSMDTSCPSAAKRLRDDEDQQQSKRQRFQGKKRFLFCVYLQVHCNTS